MLTTANQKVWDIFQDISSDFEALQELQYLLDRWAIFPDRDGNFSPNSSLSKDEFVGMLMEVGCENCILPHTSYSHLDNYSNNFSFWDLDDTNRYAYCIESAQKQWYFSSFSLDCQNGFCPEQTITTQQAIALALTTAWLFSPAQNGQVITKIANWEMTQNLANDVWAVNPDGTPNIWYGYLQKALGTSITQADISGNITTKRLLSPDANGNINPELPLTKLQAIKIAYIISQLSPCREDPQNLWVQITIYESVCTPNSTNCRPLGNVGNKNTFDFSIMNQSSCSEWTKDPFWIFYSQESRVSFIRSGNYLDDLELSPGKWVITWVGKDNCENTGVSYSFVEVGNTSNILQVQSTPSAQSPNTLQFDITTSCMNCRFDIDFWNGTLINNTSSKTPQHTFEDKGIYKVMVSMKDQSGQYIAQANVDVSVSDDLDLSEIDTDWDGVMDSEDACRTISGPARNTWCPILDQVCLPESELDTCGAGYECANTWYCEVIKHSSTPLSQPWVCSVPQNGSSIFGSVACNSCPCSLALDFGAGVRRCDIIIPAIVSPNGTQIYSRWPNYLIPYKYK